MTQDDLCRRNPDLNKRLTINKDLWITANTTTSEWRITNRTFDERIYEIDKAICDGCKRHSCEQCVYRKNRRFYQ